MSQTIPGPGNPDITPVPEPQPPQIPDEPQIPDPPDPSDPSTGDLLRDA
jgi:hypothetical protein